MKNSRKITIKSMIMLLIVILIPLLGAFFIGSYGYNRYRDTYFNDYMNTINEDTMDQFLGYAKYMSQYYEEEPFYEIDVQKDDTRVMTVAIYRTIVVYEETNYLGEITEHRVLVYHFLAYNINYNKLIEIKDPTGETKLRYNMIPSIYVRITDVNDVDKKELLTYDIPGGFMQIEDVNSSPEVDSRGDALNSRFLKAVELIMAEDLSQELSIQVLMSDDIASANPINHSVITTFTVSNVDNDVETVSLDTFDLGYNGSVSAAGYFSFVFKTKLWWQSLMAFVLIGFVSFSFYVVWQAEEINAKEKEIKTKRERKK